MSSSYEYGNVSGASGKETMRKQSKQRDVLWDMPGGFMCGF
jgi:hypothetical protein